MTPTQENLKLVLPPTLEKCSDKLLNSEKLEDGLEERRLNVSSFKTREEWLNKAAEILSERVFKRSGYEVPKVYISMGFTSTGRKGKRIGEHWSPSASDDGRGQIFITPSLGLSGDKRGMDILDVLVHELVHAAVGNEHGHGKVFKKCALAVGLEGKMRATTANKGLQAVFHDMIDFELGPIPHGVLNSSGGSRKKQSTRMVKMTCDEHGYIVRGSRKVIAEFGPALCPACEKAMTVEMKGGEDE